MNSGFRRHMQRRHICADNCAMAILMPVYINRHVFAWKQPASLGVGRGHITQQKATCHSMGSSRLQRSAG